MTIAGHSGVINHMRLTRPLAILAALVAATSAFAQFTQDQKQEVLSEIDQVLSKKAFVPGVDMSKWNTFIASRKDQIDAVESPGQFAGVVNGALREFGISHILLLRDRMHRWGGDDSLGAQGRMIRQPRVPALGWPEPETALLRIPSFEGTYDQEGVAELMDEAKDAKNLIVDLRGDPGGEVENMRQFLGLLMPANSLVGTFVSRGMADHFAASDGVGNDPIKIAAWAHNEFHPTSSGIEPFKGHIAVLVDSGSASAAEIVANALHEIRNSPIIGTPTAGAVLESTFGRLSYGFRIQFPVGDYVSHGGARLEGHPLKPDVIANSDAAVDAAIARLKATNP